MFFLYLFVNNSLILQKKAIRKHLRYGIIQKGEDNG